MIPHKYKENPSLGTWVDTQRRRYRKYLAAQKESQNDGNCGSSDPNNGTCSSTCSTSNTNGDGKTRISKEQVERLLGIGFVFEPRLSREETWNKRVEELSRFKHEHGHCNVREDDTSNPGLGKWVSYIRRSHRLAKQGKREKGKRLSDERIAQLKAIGFVFELKEEMEMKRYRDGVELLKEFLTTQGHCCVPTFYASNPFFGLCVEDMRKEYRKYAAGKDCSLGKDVLNELTSMGFLSEENLFGPASTQMNNAQHQQSGRETLQLQQQQQQQPHGQDQDQDEKHMIEMQQHQSEIECSHSIQ